MRQGWKQSYDTLGAHKTNTRALGHGVRNIPDLFRLTILWAAGTRRRSSPTWPWTSQNDNMSCVYSCAYQTFAMWSNICCMHRRLGIALPKSEVSHQQPAKGSSRRRRPGAMLLATSLSGSSCRATLGAIRGRVCFKTFPSVFLLSHG